ncbi:putative RNA-directed DNA polymerase [Tanacetum coccineum]
MDVTWIIFGDFNAVRFVDERDESRFNVTEANAFNDFIARLGLYDFLLGGRRFTRFDRSRFKLSKLDRFLASHEFFDLWIDASVTVLCRSFLNHCPLKLLASYSPRNSPNLRLKDKVKHLRMDVKNWISIRLSFQRVAKDHLSRALVDWDIKAEARLLNHFDIDKREAWVMDLQALDQFNRDDLKQKSRNKFSSFKIKGIIVNGSWCVSHDNIKQAVVNHFSGRFKECVAIRPLFRSLLFRKLCVPDAIFLESDITLVEVKEAIWSCSGSKSPGPATGILSNGCNPSFIVLIPKKSDPLGFSDYIPISLFGCIYKVISKILALRLAKVILSIIEPNQTAFLVGRQILDGFLIANELIHMVKIENHKFLLFKVDFEKAFDSVNWSFLLDVMEKMGFSLKWRNWIRACLSSASILILINGSPSNEFRMERGLHQGDPLSPFLFLLVSEALQVSIIEACSKGFYKGVFLAKDGSNVSLLQYVDDALFFGKWSRSNARNLILILKCFEEASGLTVNLLKSRLFGIGVDSDEVKAVASSLNCSHDSVPFTYLGLLVGKRMYFCDGWIEVINKVRNRLTAWKAKSLFIGGHLTLLKSVLGSIPIYYLSPFKASLKVIKYIESLRSRFFWGFKDDHRGISWVKWDSILDSPEFGGLGIGSLLAKNIALLGKWKWRFLSEKDALRRTAICNFYGGDGGFSISLTSLNGHGVWCDIVKVISNIERIDFSFKNSFTLKVSNGLSTSF